MSHRFPNYERIPESPKVSDGFLGVTIEFPKVIDLTTGPSLPVFGAFQISDLEASAIAGQDPYRAIVILLIDTSGYVARSFNAAGQSIMLEPAKAPPGMFRGYFNVDVFRMAKTQPRAGRFFISAYLDVYRSPSLPVDVTGEPPKHTHGH